MRNLLCVILLFEICECSEGMLGTSLVSNKQKIRASMVSINADEQARKIADRYMSEEVIDKSSESIVKAILEADSRTFWNKNGKIGNYKAYAGEICRLLLDMISDIHTPVMDDLRLVINGLINGKVESAESLSPNKFVKLGIKKSTLSKIGIW